MHHLGGKCNIRVVEVYVKSLSREKFETYITNSWYGFNQLKLKKIYYEKKIQEQKYEKYELQNYVLELQPDIAREAFKVRTRVTDIQKNYLNKHSCHLCPVCELEVEAMHHLVACNVNMSIEDFRKVCGK